MYLEYRKYYYKSIIRRNDPIFKMNQRFIDISTKKTYGLESTAKDVNISSYENTNIPKTFHNISTKVAAIKTDHTHCLLPFATFQLAPYLDLSYFIQCWLFL